ncbi:hypothetical protein [Mycobacterium helveticum]|uniref:hypothetical protein n=1 Tax=Mycobacterium helveticum TaxID=2592811 RepID=UPI003CCC6EE6
MTGGTTAIGRGIVERLVSEGASVITCARRAPESPLPDGAMFIAADITGRGGSIRRHQCGSGPLWAA